MTSGEKPVLRGILLIVIVCGIAAVCLLTRPKPERYTFRIIVPAGTQERFVYSEEEFRATKNTVRIWLNGGLGDTEVLLTPVEETMETGYTAVYLTQGMPAEFDADKRIWFRVGVKAQNMTDEDIIVYLTVENAEIRGRSSDENSPDSITFEAEILEIRDGYFLVKPEAGWAINSAALLEVPMENMEPSPALQVGDVIEITYDGRILETDPGRIHTVYRIRIAQEPDDPRAYESGGNGDGDFLYVARLTMTSAAAQAMAPGTVAPRPKGSPASFQPMQTVKPAIMPERIPAVVAFFQ